MSPTLALTGLLAIAIGLVQESGSAEGQEEAPTSPPPFATYRQREQAQLEADIAGAWILLSYETQAELFDKRDVQGFATFQDGRLVLILQAVDAFDDLLGPEYTYALHAGVHHYRVSPLLSLQTSRIMEYVAYPGDDPPASRPVTLREYHVRVVNDELVLTHVDATRMVFRRTRAGAFPLAAIEELASFPGTPLPEGEPAPKPQLDDGVAGSPPLTTLRERQLAELEQHISGGWVLREYVVPGVELEDGDVRGHVGFTAGYMTLVLEAGELEEVFFGQPEFLHHFQAGVHRYRLTAAPSIQTAAVMGHSRYGADSELVFERSQAAREYRIDLEDRGVRGVWLHITMTDGTRMSLQRLGPAEFPKKAIRALDQGLHRLPGAAGDPGYGDQEQR